MLKGDVKTALKSLRSARWRSILTMLGIVIGVVSVITTVSLGEGIKRQVIGQIGQLGDNLITARPGRLVERNSSGEITKVNVSSSYSFNSGSLPAKDIEVIQKTKGVDLVAPIGLVTATAKHEDRNYEGQIIGTSSALPAVLNQKIAYGSTFEEGDEQAPIAIIGSSVAVDLFEDKVPLGYRMNILGREVVVRGVFETFNSPPLALGPDFNKTIFIPFGTAHELTGGSTQLVQVLASISGGSDVSQTVANLNQELYKAHGEQNDFTVLRQSENLAVTSETLTILTAFVAGIAAISLLVGGIGIMNIMLVAVTERTREIGIRKAVGATNGQILSQFLIEALALSIIGVAIGLVFAGAINVALRLATYLQPVITPQIVIISAAVSILVGVIFGIMPAAKAASKDPIEALRYE